MNGTRLPRIDNEEPDIVEYSFPWPVSQGEWLAWAAAAVTVLIGLFHLFMPGLSLRLRRLRTAQAHPEALAEVRGPTAGFQIGLGLGCLLLAQPLVYFALGLAWGFALFGRLVSILSDRGGTLYNWARAAGELVLTLLPLAFVFGFAG